MVNKADIHKRLINELRTNIRKHSSSRMSPSEEETETGMGGNVADTHYPETDEPDGDELGQGPQPGNHDETDSDEPSDMTPEEASEVEDVAASCDGCGGDVVPGKYCSECGTKHDSGEEEAV